MHGTLHRASILAVLAAGLVAAPAVHTQQSVRLPEKDRPLALRTTPVFSVGKAEGNESEMFTRVDQVAFDRSDNLYVLDGGGNRVLVFDRTGRFVRQVGKKGGGPGEFMMPLGLAVLSDGTLAVADLGHRSYSLFAADGRYQRSIPFAEPWMPLLMNGRMAGHPRGGIVATVRTRPAMGMTRPSPTEANPVVWQPFAQNAKAVTLFNAAVEVNTKIDGGPAQGGRQSVSVRSILPSFMPTLSWGLLPGGGMVVSNSPGYTLRVTDANGRLVRYVQKPLRVRKVTERDRERERDQMRANLASGTGLRSVTVGGGGGSMQRPEGMPKERIEQMVSEMQFGDVIPEIQDLRVDAAGRVWVERTGAVWGEQGPIDIVTAEGRYLGTVTGQKLPSAFSASGRAAYIEEDDMGVQRVVVRQVAQF